jgi:hypothetical protein
MVKGLQFHIILVFWDPDDVLGMNAGNVQVLAHNRNSVIRHLAQKIHKNAVQFQ